MGSSRLVIGGARSGKSEFAEQLLAQATGRKGYIATSRIGDAEMRERVRTHRARRPSAWATFELPTSDMKALADILPQADVFLFDCVTMYVNNLLLDELGDLGSDVSVVFSESEIERITERLRGEMATLETLLNTHDAQVIFVTNELGMGIVPNNAMSRLYRDLVGLANQELSAISLQVELVVAGIPVRLKRGERQ